MKNFLKIIFVFFFNDYFKELDYLEELVIDLIKGSSSPLTTIDIFDELDDRLDFINNILFKFKISYEKEINIGQIYVVLNRLEKKEIIKKIPKTYTTLIDEISEKHCIYEYIFLGDKK